MQPIVLAHGFLGYRHFLLWHQFPGVIEALQERGIPALQPLVHPTETIEYRARQLLEAINQAFGEHEPIHIIGHSMGGLDARYLISPNGLAQGHRVISLTTISTPHHGSSLANWIGAYIKPIFTNGCRLLQYIFLGESRELVRQIAQNRWGGLDQLRPAYLEKEFNPNIVDDPRVSYFSYAGFVENRITLDNFFRYPLLYSMYKREGMNDSMVAVESAKWGTYKGCLHGDHGELMGVSVLPWKEPAFDVKTFILHRLDELEHIEVPSQEKEI